MCNCTNKTKCAHSLGVTRQIVLNNDTVGRDGESAYETYVRFGGTLTEKDWLASLKGDGVQLKGSVDTYQDLESLADTAKLGDSWLVNSSGMMYTFGNGGFPPENMGIKISGDEFIPELTTNYFDNL